MYRHATHLYFIALLWSLLTTIAPSQALANEDTQASGPEQHLTVGYPKNLFFSYDMGDIHIGDPAICNYRPDRVGKKITLAPLQQGETRLIVYDSSGKQRDAIRLVVYSKDLDRYAEELAQLFKDIEGVEINRVGGKIILEGEVYFSDDLGMIARITADNPSVINKVKLSKNAQRILSQKIKKEIGEPDINVSPFRDKLIIKGRVYNKRAAENAEKIAKLYWDPPTSVVNVLDIIEEEKAPERADTIQVSAHYIELAKQLNQNFLFKWAPFPDVNASASMNFDPNTGNNQITGAVVAQFTELIPRLNYMKSLGVVRVMENPTVSVKSGSSANLSSGTQILIPIATEGGGSRITTQQIGVQFSVTPRKLQNEVDLDINISVSALGSPSPSGNINISHNSVSTNQIIRSGESVVIGGVLRTSISDTRDRQPEAAQANPGLFTLFKTKDFQIHRGQFLVFITPKIFEFSKDSHQELKDYFNLYDVFPKISQQAGQ